MTHIARQLRSLPTWQAVARDLAQRRGETMLSRVLQRILNPSTPDSELDELMGLIQLTSGALLGQDPVMAAFVQYWNRVGDPAGVGDHRFSSNTYLASLGIPSQIRNFTGVQTAILRIADYPSSDSARRRLWEALRATLATGRNSFTPASQSLEVSGVAEAVQVVNSAIARLGPSLGHGGYDSEHATTEALSMTERGTDPAVARAIQEANTPPGGNRSTTPVVTPTPIAPANPGAQPSRPPAIVPAPDPWANIGAGGGGGNGSAPGPSNPGAQGRGAPATVELGNDGGRVVPSGRVTSGLLSALQQARFKGAAIVGIRTIMSVLKVDRRTAVLFVRVIVALVQLMIKWQSGDTTKVGTPAVLAYGAETDALLASLDDSGDAETFGTRTTQGADLFETIYQQQEGTQ